MDPKACLDRCEDACDACDWTEARYALRDYAEWRRRGGFEPDGGDARSRVLSRRIRVRS